MWTWPNGDYFLLLNHIPNSKLKKEVLKYQLLGSGCGSVSRLVASDTRGLWFKFSHRQTFISNICLLSTVLKSKNKEKEARNISCYMHKLFFCWFQSEMPGLIVSTAVAAIWINISVSTKSCSVTNKCFESKSKNFNFECWFWAENSKLQRNLPA